MTVWTVWLLVVMVHSSGGDALFVSVTSSTLLVKRSDADPGQYVWTDPVLTGEMEKKHAKLGGVTAVFPSITLASWASIFTGEQPGKTGQLGNEFFARDLLGQPGTPALAGNPQGVVSYSSGAFPGYDTVGIIKLLDSDFYPVTRDVDAGVGFAKTEATKQNAYLQAGTLYKQLRGPTGTDGRAGRTVVVGNFYAKDADVWLTYPDVWSSSWEAFKSLFGAGGTVANLYDRSSRRAAFDYLKNNRQSYLDAPESFPGLFVYYLSGHDHEEHVAGVGASGEFFVKVTDWAVSGFVDKLKELGQFYNKVFLITSDHGHTEMAALGSVTLPSGEEVAPDISCKYRIKGFGDELVQAAEQANNNLHVWELGRLLTLFPSSKTTFNLLAPKALKGTGIDLAEEAGNADVVAALNGPMAHIYVKGSSWTDDPDPVRLAAAVYRILRVFMRGYEVSEGDFGGKLKENFPRLLGSVDQILVRKSREGGYEVVKSVSEDAGGIPSVDTVPLSSSALADGSVYVKALERIGGMNHKDRSGDIVLLFKSDVNNIADRFTSGVSCKSWHGSLNRTDSYVPFIVSYPGGNASELDKPIEDVCPGKQCAGNWKATDLIKNIIETQYSGR